MPLPNYHAARLRNPDKYDSFNTTKGGKIYGKITVPATINVVWGKIGADVVVPQALRFNKASWSVSVAKKWLADHRIKYKIFEPAKEADKMADEEEVKLDDDYEVEVPPLPLTMKQLDKMDDMQLGEYVRKRVKANIDRKRINISMFVDEQKKTEETDDSESEPEVIPDEIDPDDEIEEFSETFELKARPIFQVCTAHDVEYKLADLKQIVANFKKFKGKVIPPLKLGHGDQDGIKGLAKGASNGMPAAGWVDRIWLEGKQILADFRDIPKRVYDLLVKKAYDRISVELYPDFKFDDGKQHGITLAAVAVLGAEPPAIKSLPAIEARYSEDVDRNDELVTILYEEVSDVDTVKEEKEETTESEDKTKTESPPKEEAKTETTDSGGDKDVETQEQLKELTETVDKLTVNLATATEVIDLQQAQMGLQRTEARKEKEKVLLSELKEAGKWLPANDPKIIRLFDSVADIDTVVKFTEERDGEKVEVEKRPYDLAIELLNALPKAVDFQEHAKGEEEKEEVVDKEFTADDDKVLVGNDLAAKVNTYMEEHQDVNYHDAMIAVSR